MSFGGLDLFTSLLGAYFLFWGINAWARWITPPPPSPKLGQFLAAYDQAKVLATLVKVFEIVGAILIFVPRFRYLGLVIIGAISFVILVLQLSLNKRGGIVVSLQILFLYTGALFENPKLIEFFIGVNG